MLDLDLIITRLRHSAEIISSMVQNIPQERAAIRPEPARWSIVEVISHLYEEEQEDFRTRIDYTLHKPGTPWPPIDPEGWVTSRKYGERDLAESLRNFLDRRNSSLEWLRRLESPDWNTAYIHPVRGPISAGDILASWAAHDYLHIRQLARNLYEDLKQEAVPYSTEYAM